MGFNHALFTLTALVETPKYVDHEKLERNRDEFSWIIRWDKWTIYFSNQIHSLSLLFWLIDVGWATWVSRCGCWKSPFLGIRDPMRCTRFVNQGEMGSIITACVYTQRNVWSWYQFALFFWLHFKYVKLISIANIIWYDIGSI